jgi:hypothetical protein
MWKQRGKGGGRRKDIDEMLARRAHFESVVSDHVFVGRKIRKTVR